MIRQLLGVDGVVVGVAADHRDAFQRALEGRGLQLSADEVVERKLDICRELSPLATCTLLDGERSAPRAMAEDAIAAGSALLVPLEAQGYGALHEVEATTLIPGWSPARAHAAGFDGVKLLLPYRADVPGQAARQRELVARLVRECDDLPLVLVLEPIVYRHPGEDLDDEAFAQLVTAGARELAQVIGPAHLLKLQYPGRGACGEVTAACAGVHWVLLGGGAPRDELAAQVVDACREGASGFIIGRTLWEPALVADRTESLAALRDTAHPWLDELSLAARAAVSNRGD